jgi:hypothetical protein
VISLRIETIAHELPLVEPEVQFELHPLTMHSIVQNQPTTYPIGSRPSFDPIQVEHRKHLHVVTSVGEYFNEHPETISKSISWGRLNDSSPLTSFSSKTQSQDCSHSRFSRQICTYLVKASLFLLSILFGFGIVHLSVHDSDGVDS